MSFVSAQYVESMNRNLQDVAGKVNVSFEFFPPKTAEGMDKLREARKELAKFNPEFFSVTFGAGGSTRDRTMETVLEIQREGFQAAPHISCISSSKACGDR